ncbi:hypothetical protein MMC21_002327 [Puttea exsequens]|nr:hypothetical protein [Puttea exsequens]
MAVLEDDVFPTSVRAQGTQVKLIVTLFHKNRRHPISEDTTAAFSSLLQDCTPSFNLQSSTDFKHLTPSILQACYVLENPLFDDRQQFRTSQIQGFEEQYDLEIILDQFPSSTENAIFRPIKLALFDMDSTLIDQEVIDELAGSIGIGDAISAMTASALNGEVDFATSLKIRVSMLKGVPVTIWEDLKKNVSIAKGAKALVTALKAKGVLTGVISGGFTPMAEWLKGELDLDIAVANHLIVEDSTEEFPFPHLSGQLNADFPIVEPKLKRDILMSLAAQHDFKIPETLAVGDGSNDLPMLRTAGLGIAWGAKPKVQAVAPMRLNGESLTDLLYLLGLHDEVDSK